MGRVLTIVDEFASVDERSAGRLADILQDTERIVKAAGGSLVLEGPLTCQELVGMIKETKDGWETGT